MTQTASLNRSIFMRAVVGACAGLLVLTMSACGASGGIDAPVAGTATSVEPGEAPPSGQRLYELLLTTSMSSDGLPRGVRVERMSRLVFADAGPDNHVGAVKADLVGVPTDQNLSLDFVVYADAAAASARAFRGEPVPPPDPAMTTPLPISDGTGWCEFNPEYAFVGSTCHVISGDTVVSATATPSGDEPRSTWSPLDAETLATVGAAHLAKVRQAAISTAAEPSSDGAPATGAATASASTSSAPAPDALEVSLTKVTVDGWRYGVAWTSLRSDIGSGADVAAPGQAYYTFTVRLVNLDDRRPEAPLPNSLSVGYNLGFAFYSRHVDDSCASRQDGDTVCELTTGVYYSGCSNTRDDTVAGALPLGGVIERQCRIDGTYPEGWTSKDVVVGYHWRDDSGTEQQVLLPPPA